MKTVIASRFTLMPVLILSFVLCFCLSPSLSAIAGPFDIDVKQIEECPHSENDDFKLTYKLKKYNRTALVVDGTMNMTSALDLNTKLTVIVDKFSNNKYKENVVKKEFDSTCQTAETFVPGLMKKFYKITGVKSCPIPPGVYTEKNFNLNLDVQLPSFFYSKYRVTFKMFSKNNKRKLCMYIYIDIIPKKSRG